MNDDPITYVEHRWDGRRTFRLYQDRIVVEFHVQHSHGEATISLADLRPTPDKIFGRPTPIKLGLWLLAAAVLSSGAAWAFAEIPYREELAIGGVSIAFLALIIIAYCWRKMEFARFPSHQGVALLDVGCWSRDDAAFREFVAELCRRIEHAQTK